MRIIKVKTQLIRIAGFILPLALSLKFFGLYSLEPLFTDFLIVGNGTAGATLARFTSDPVNDQYINDVVVLEAGSNYSNDPAVLQGAPFGDTSIASDPKYSTTFLVNAANLNSGLAGFAYTDGRMWGGSSAHNGMFAARGTPRLYDSWATISGNSQWSYNNLLPLMKFMETYIPNGTIANPAQRGTNGPLIITQDPPIINPFLTALATATNAPLVSDYNDPSLGDVGVSVHQWWSTQQPNSVRSFAINAFLGSTVVDPNTGLGVGGRKLQIISRATVSRIIFLKTLQGPVAIGVEYILNKNREKVRRIFARKKIILCAGAIQDPAILQRSGVGPAALLNSLNIPVVVDNPNVGANLQNHYGSAAIIGLDTQNPLPFQLIDAFNDLSGPNLNPPDGIRRNQMYASITTAFFPEPSVPTALDISPTSCITLIPMELTPNSRGTVQIADSDPLTDPRVNFNFYSDTASPTDLDRAVAGYKVVANVAAAYGQPVLYPPASHYPAPYGTAPDDSILRQDTKVATAISYHAVGTCKMGSAVSDGAVVDGYLNVFGVNNLMIADCSIQPFIEDGNTAYSAYLIGLVAAKNLGAQIP